MNRLLYRYLAREILVPLLLGLAAFTGILFVGRLLNLTNLMVSSNIPLTTMLRLLANLLPTFCLITIPMSFLLAVLLAFGRLSSDSEIIAMKASGISLTRMLPPVLGLAAACTAITMTIALSLLPQSSRTFKTLLKDAIQEGANLAIREGVFNDRFPGIVLYCAGYDPQSRSMGGILIQDERNARAPLTIFAASGSISPDPDGKRLRLVLRNGSIHGTRGKTDYRLVSFAAYSMDIPISQRGGPSHNEDDMPLGELLARIRAGGDDARAQRNMQIELHQRFAFPVACLIFAFIGMPLGIQNQRSGKGAGFTVSIAIFVAYYVVLSIGKTLGQKGVAPPGLAIWFPNLLFFAMGITLFVLTTRETRLKLPDIRHFLPIRRPKAEDTDHADH